MTRNQKLEDRRNFPRYHPDEEHAPKVKFIFNGGSNVDIATINISKGGLMGYTSSIEHFLGIQDQYIDIIEIIFPGKKPFRCSGHILRLQPSINENKCFCAVEFGEPVNADIESMESENSEKSSHGDESGDDDNNNGRTRFMDSSIYRESSGEEFTFDPEIRENLNNLIIDTTQKPKKNKDNSKIIIPDGKILNRIKELENYAKIDEVEKEVEVRRLAYNSFDDITEYLTIEEKWWFFEMLDEMKRHEPNYPENLKRAFFKLYRTGLQQAQNLQMKPNERKYLRQSQ
ncbi:hypothetical protein GF337_12760 [candidate division KSB1 bacterium]|nr:hypothetical protein [candidate division KSB1 bacterium]